MAASPNYPTLTTTNGSFVITDCNSNTSYVTTYPPPGFVECCVCGQTVSETDATRLTPAQHAQTPAQQSWVSPAIQTPNYWQAPTYSNYAYIEYKWLCHGCQTANNVNPPVPFTFPQPVALEPVDVDAIRKDLEDLEQELR